MLFSDRTGTAYLRSNQLRLYFSSFAYVLLQMLWRLGLQGTELANTQCSTIRLKLLKIRALIRISVRNVWISLAGGYPYLTHIHPAESRICLSSGDPRWVLSQSGGLGTGSNFGNSTDDRGAGASHRNST